MSDEQPIIKKIKKVEGHGHHGGAWKVAYADFVTAMMAFFLVMWILGLSDNQKKGIAQFFKEPGAFSFLTGKAMPVQIENIAPTKGSGDGGKGKDSKAEVLTAEEKKVLLEERVQDTSRIETLAKEMTEQLEKISKSDPAMQQLIQSMNVLITNEGLRIELVESSESAFFEVGSARLNKQGLELLKQVAAEVGKMPNFVEIEGHTDTRGYGKNNAYTNWELSSDRANSARRILEEYGLWEGQVIGVKGYADRKLKTPENPFDISNRRVTILVRYRNNEAPSGA